MRKTLAQEVDFSKIEETIPDFKFAGGDIGPIVSELIKYLFPLAGLLLLLYLLFGGLQLMTSGGDPKKMQDAKGKLTNALIGFMIVFVSYWLVQIIGRILGIEAIANIFGGGGGGGGCFPAGTKVKMADGTFKEIQKIKSGDVVYSYNLKKDKLVKADVEESIVHNNYPGGYLVISDKLKVTQNHRMWVVNKSSWEKADSLNVGDSLLNPTGEKVLITTIAKVEGNNTVYNLHLEGKNHNYFAESVLVHNVKVP